MKKSTVLLTLVICLFLNSLVLAKTSPHILIFSKTKGWHHSSITKGLTTLKEYFAKNGVNADTSSNASVFTDKGLQQYKVVVFLNTTGDILDSIQQLAFQKYIRSGKGFVGIHAATDTEYDWPWYNKLAGAYFKSHPKDQQQATINITDRNHPATAMLPEKWQRTDEWYNFKDISPDIRVLGWLDESTYQGGENGEKHPFIWYHEFEGGRAFYTGCGHREDNYDEPLLLQHIFAAIKWAGKLK